MDAIAIFSGFTPSAQSWALERREERMHKRASSSMIEIRAFFDEVRPHLKEMLTYLNQFPVDRFPAEAMPMLWICLAIVEVAKPVELWHAPDVEAFAVKRVMTYYERQPIATPDGLSMSNGKEEQ